ncbi:MAG: hypothetical protein PVJ92_02515 [Candidatus Dependentiae bacterium]|jgi:hypothetical protein
MKKEYWILTCVRMTGLAAFAGMTIASAAAPHGYTVLHHRHHADLRTLPLTNVHDGTEKGEFLDGTLQVTGFYEQLLTSKKVGKFLGVAPTNTEYNLVHIAPDTVVAAKGADAINNHFVHADPTAPANTAAVKLQLSPSYIYYGALPSLDLKLPFWSNWYVGAQLPVADCRTNVHRAEKQASSSNPGELLNYFAGTYASEASTHRQEKIGTGIFDATLKQQSGMPHVDVWLRKELFTWPRLAIHGKALLTVPLIEPAGATHLHGPTLGSNGHWAASGQLRAVIKVWEKYSKAVELHAGADLRYVLGAKEQRIMPLSTDVVAHPFGHYALLTHVTHAANEPLVPAINRLTKKVMVTPGLQYEMHSSLRYRTLRWQLEAGYTFVHEAAESLGSFKWEDDTYRLAGSTYNTTQSYAAQTGVGNAFTAVALQNGSSHTFLQKTDLAPARAGHPERELHTMWGQIVYRVKNKYAPLSFHAGIAGTASGSSFVGHALSAWGGIQLRL